MYWPNKIITTISLIGAFAFVTLSPPARAVIPAPDGGYPNQNTAEGEDAVLSRNTPASGTWTATGSMGTARYEHTATLLPNGKVLVAGGYNGPALSSAELYDPASGTWTATGSMGTARGEHTATLLPSGKVLVAGGFDLSNALSSAELYDPVTGTWTATGSMSTARYDHTATLLPNGQALVAAGTDSDFRPLRSAELYDPASGTWSATGSMGTARFDHTATLLPSGEVLVAGGYNFNDGYLSSAELYDPASGTWSATGGMGTARAQHTATLLPNGKVLVAGGSNGVALSSAELYVSDGGGELTLVSAASRKTHGSKGAFDISLPLTGDLGIECRTGLTRNVVVMTFNNNVTGADSASSSCGTIGSVSVDPADAHNLLVTFNGAGCNASTVTVTATNVHDDQGNTLSSASASMGILVGDVTGDGRVTNGDTAVVQAVQGQQTNASNFRDDVTLDGKVNTQDVQTVRSHRGEVLP